MQKELIDKANEIIGLIEKNERAVEELEKCLNGEGGIYVGGYGVGIGACNNPFIMCPSEIDFEPWEIRLMIHNKKQRIKALKAQLERM